MIHVHLQYKAIGLTTNVKYGNYSKPMFLLIQTCKKNSFNRNKKYEYSKNWLMFVTTQ